MSHWGRVTHICVSKLHTIGSDNGWSPGRSQTIIWTNAGIFLFGPLGSNFSEILIEIDTFSFKKMHLKLSFAKWRPFCLGLNVLSIRCPTSWWFYSWAYKGRQNSSLFCERYICWAVQCLYVRYWPIFAVRMPVIFTALMPARVANVISLSGRIDIAAF